MALLHQCCVNDVFMIVIILYRTVLLSFLQSVDETFTFTLTGANVLIYSKEGAFDNGTFSSPSKVL